MSIVAQRTSLLPSPPTSPLRRSGRSQRRGRMGLVGIAVLAFVLAVSATPSVAATEEGDSSSALTPAPDEDPKAPEPGIREIVFPVVGPHSFVDTWGACRGSRCSRSHKGVDIFGPKLAPLVAAADGVIIANRQSALTTAGNTVIIRDDEGWSYLYIHLNNDSPGTDDGANPQGWILPNRLRIGDRVKAGDVIGYLGDSGNAENTPNHLHFEIRQPGVGAINPTPSAQAALDQNRVIDPATLTSSAEGRAEAGPVVEAWYRALLKREPSEAELYAWSDRIAIGFATKDDLIADLTMAKSRRDPAGAVLRSFHVVVGRRPTINELREWERELRDGSDVEDINAALLASPQFTERHGSLSDEELVRVLYDTGVGREPTADRLEHWLNELADGTTRASVAAQLAQSFTVKNATWHGVEVVQAYRAALDRLPDDQEYEFWVGHLNSGGLIPDVVDGIRAKREADSAAEEGTSEDAEPTAAADSEG